MRDLDIEGVVEAIHAPQRQADEQGPSERRAIDGQRQGDGRAAETRGEGERPTRLGARREGMRDRCHPCGPLEKARSETKASPAPNLTGQTTRPIVKRP